MKRNIEMTHLTDEQIEDAFARIRAEFEKRNNETGLEILDSYEERWAVSENLSDRQIAWLEKQLDGTWREVGSKSVSDATVTADPEPNDEAELLDAMIESRLAAQGKTLIDAGQIDRLRQAVSDLNDALGGLGD
jgi:hypothetical protein